jgi:hypothetical protein
MNLLSAITHVDAQTLNVSLKSLRVVASASIGRNSPPKNIGVMTQEELNLMKRIAESLEKQADATDRMADYLSTIAYNVQQSGK